MLIFVLYDEPGYVGDADQASCTLLLLLLYGAAALPMVYCYSFGFESHSTAQIVIMVLNIISGFVFVIAHFVMSTLPSTQDADRVLVHLYRLTPPYVFGEALLTLSSAWYQNELVAGEELGVSRVSVWDYDVAGRSLVVLPLEAAAYTLLLLLLEYRRAVLARLAPCTAALLGAAEPELRLASRTKAGLACALGLAALLTATTGERGDPSGAAVGWPSP